MTTETLTVTAHRHATSVSVLLVSADCKNDRKRSNIVYNELGHHVPVYDVFDWRFSAEKRDDALKDTTPTHVLILVTSYFISSWPSKDVENLLENEALVFVFLLVDVAEDEFKKTCAGLIKRSLSVTFRFAEDIQWAAQSLGEVLSQPRINGDFNAFCDIMSSESDITVVAQNGPKLEPSSAGAGTLGLAKEDEARANLMQSSSPLPPLLDGNKDVSVSKAKEKDVPTLSIKQPEREGIPTEEISPESVFLPEASSSDLQESSIGVGGNHEIVALVRQSLAGMFAELMASVSETQEDYLKGQAQVKAALDKLNRRFPPLTKEAQPSVVSSSTPTEASKPSRSKTKRRRPRSSRGSLCSHTSQTDADASSTPEATEGSARREKEKKVYLTPLEVTKLQRLAKEVRPIAESNPQKGYKYVRRILRILKLDTRTGPEPSVVRRSRPLRREEESGIGSSAREETSSDEAASVSVVSSSYSQGKSNLSLHVNEQAVVAKRMEWNSVTVGESGGKVVLRKSGTVLRVPPGALDGDHKLTLSMFRQALGRGSQLTALELLPHGTKFKKTVTVEQKLKFHERPGNICVKVRLAFFYGRGLTEETYRPMGIIDSDSDSTSPFGYKKMSLGLSSSRESYEFRSRSLCIVCRVDFADTFVTKIRLFGKPKSGALKELRLLAVASCSCEELHEVIQEREKKKGFTFSTELCDITDMRQTAADQRINFVLHEDEEETWSMRGTMSFRMHQFLHILDCNHPFDFKQECRLKLKEEAERSNDSLTVHLVCQREDGKNERHLILAETSSNDVAQAGKTEQSEPQLLSDSDGGPDSGLGDSLSNDGSPNDVLRGDKMNPADLSGDTDQSRDFARKRDTAYRKKLRVFGSLVAVVAALALVLYIVPTIFRSNGSTKATVAYDNQVKKASSPEEYEKYKDAVAIAISDGFTANMLETAITGVAGKHCKKLWDALEFQDSEDHCKESGNWAVKTLLSAFQDEFGTDFLVRRKMINACLKIRVLGRLLEKLKAEQQF